MRCKPDTLNSYLEKMGIVYKGNQGGKGFHGETYVPVEEYITRACVKSPVLKQKLIREGIKEEKCECCGLSEWLDQKIPLELHHKDLDHYNNNLNNLQILCPNCHALQPGNSGANSGRYKMDK